MTTNFGGVRGAIAGCHCSVLWFGGRVTTNFGGVDGGRCWVPFGAFFLYIDNKQIGFCYLGLCRYNFFFNLRVRIRRCLNCNHCRLFHFEFGLKPWKYGGAEEAP